MNIHIVRVNEKIEKIALLYNLTVDEIIDCNHHIKDWEHLIPGTKLKLPEIPEIVRTELDNTEPFIEEYYPKIDVQTILEKEQTEKKQNDTIVIKGKEEPLDASIYDNQLKDTSPTEHVKNQPVNKNKTHTIQQYPPYYGYYYPYYGNNGFYSNRKYYSRKKKTK